MGGTAVLSLAVPVGKQAQDREGPNLPQLPVPQAAHWRGRDVSWPRSGPGISPPSTYPALSLSVSCLARYTPTRMSFLSSSKVTAFSLALRLGTKGSRCPEYSSLARFYSDTACGEP